jgi:outer membrane protein OmpA-like peptidoglycan-associated protein
MSESFDTYIRCCHFCQSEQSTEVLCQTCGPSRAFFSFVSDEASEVPLVCQACDQPVKKSLKDFQKIPMQCLDCRSVDLGWRRRGGLEWRPEPTEEKLADGPWVVGDFDADFEGRSSGEFRKLGSELGSDFRYSLVFKRFQLENVERVNGPPQEREHHDQVAPLRFRNIDRVFIYRPDSEGRTRVYRADLVDVRLHDWTKTINEDERQIQLSGRLQGKAYAMLRVPTEDEIRKAAPKRPDPVDYPGADDPEGTDRPFPPTSSPEEPDTTTYCNTCNLFVLGAVFLILLVACHWQTAALGVFVMAMQCWWRSYRMDRGQNRMGDGVEIGVSITLVVLALLTFLWARPEECIRTSLWWLAAMALLLVLTAVLKRCWPWLVISLLWLLMLLSIYCKSFTGDCAIPASTANTGVAASGEQLSIPSLEDLNPLPSLQEAVENVVNGVNQRLAIDQDTQVVLGDDSGRVSLDQALANPNKFFSCDSQPQQNGGQGTGRRRPYAITFSEAALFQTDDAKLRPGAEAHLNKLARLIATNPKLRVVLTGHADRSGAPEHNLELSLWRAQAVADWLITHGHLKPEQVDVRGAGDKYPIVNNPRLFQYNRRVDITVDCSERKQ